MIARRGLQPPARDRVLAIFGKAPRPGRVKSRLAVRYGDRRALALYRAMMEDTLALARSLRGVAVAVVCPRADAAEMAAWVGDDLLLVSQEGDGLAAGLTSGFRQLFEQGFVRVVAVSTDTPHLPAATLGEAFTGLETHDLVVGPSADGGYYLLGAKQVHTGLFDPAPLGTADAFASLTARAGSLGLSLTYTAPGWDIDMPEDVERLAAELAQAPARSPRSAAELCGWPELAGRAGLAQSSG